MPEPITLSVVALGAASHLPFGISLLKAVTGHGFASLAAGVMGSIPTAKGKRAINGPRARSVAARKAQTPSGQQAIPAHAPAIPRATKLTAAQQANLKKFLSPAPLSS